MAAAEAAVEARGLWKRYAANPAHGWSLKTAAVNRLLGRARPVAATWALQDVSFRAAPGEALAVIGPNGSGKTTLLGILSRVLRPTQGEAVVRGRVCVLLEAAVAFHPDLTGEENVILQGIILGMKRREVRAHLDEIVDFAEARAWVDAPVRTLSLGQRARLGFAVASHLSPDVFLIDEVLAAVDQEFHYVCYDRIREMQRAGCAVLFVSHILEQVRDLCERTVWLDQGRVVMDGPTASVLAEYQTACAQHRRPS